MYDYSDAVARTGERDFYVARHEQGAGYMAFGHAKSTGRTGVFTVVPGPGVLTHRSHCAPPSVRPQRSCV